MRRSLILLFAATLTLAAGQRQSVMSVSAVVRPGARIEVHSATAITARLTLYRNTQAMIWAAADSCGAPQQPKVLSNSGVHSLTFTAEEVAGKNLFCLVSTDGAVRTSQYVNVTNSVSK